jgi:hypothetical protein
MNKNGWILRWSKYLVVFLLAGAFAALSHEYGHFLAIKALGYHPKINFTDGRVETYDTKGNRDPELPPNEKIISSAGGPAVSLLLAVGFTLLFLRYRQSLWLFAFAITNSVIRLNMLIDGFNSDEGNISEILLKTLGNQGAFLVPLTEWTIFIALSCLLINRQEFFKKTYWLIPLFFLISAAAMIFSFMILRHIY